MARQGISDHAPDISDLPWDERISKRLVFPGVDFVAGPVMTKAHADAAGWKPPQIEGSVSDLGLYFLRDATLRWPGYVALDDRELDAPDILPQHISKWLDRNDLGDSRRFVKDRRTIDDIVLIAALAGYDVYGH